MPWHPLDQARPIGDAGEIGDASDARATDDEPGRELLMVDEWMGPWAIIRTLRFDDETWYRAVTPEVDHSNRVLIGYSQNLRALAMHAYRRFLHVRSPTTGPINGWSAVEYPTSASFTPGFVSAGR
ncbi:hypothetical protein [Marisediminicola senii]|uniref:hypothetical protein n=1 Tax=Marisediminicola senii TaxID=2711233 RepID=UPI0013EC37AE|nr:hypothetical protein [Marisediminicola senii]